MKAYAYLRVSGKGQLEQGGFDRQRDAINSHADKNGLEIANWFEEQGVSGTADWEDRPAWVEMIGNLNGVQTIIIEGLDRLARDLGVQEFILRDLRKRQITLISTREEDLGSSDPTRVLFRQIVGAVASYERSMIEAKLRAARNRKKKLEGRCEGVKPYGKDTLRPKEADTLDLMLGLYLEGHSNQAICDHFMKCGYSTRTGKPWHPATVAKILRREHAKAI